MIGVAFGVVSALGAAGRLTSGLMSAGARRAEFNEMIRGLQMKRDYTVGLAKARAAASGTEMESVSTTDYLSRLTGEFDRQIALARRTRRQTYVSDIVASLSGAAGNAADIYGSLGQMNNWWQR